MEILYTDLHVLNYPSIRKANPLIVINGLVWSCWVRLARTLLRSFVSMFIRDISLQSSFFFVFVLSLSGFGISIVLPS